MNIYNKCLNFILKFSVVGKILSENFGEGIFNFTVQEVLLCCVLLMFVTYRIPA